MQLNVKRWKRSAIQFYDLILETPGIFFFCAIAAAIIIMPSRLSRFIYDEKAHFMGCWHQHQSNERHLDKMNGWHNKGGGK